MYEFLNHLWETSLTPEKKNLLNRLVSSNDLSALEVASLFVDNFIYPGLTAYLESEKDIDTAFKTTQIIKCSLTKPITDNIVYTLEIPPLTSGIVVGDALYLDKGTIFEPYEEDNIGRKCRLRTSSTKLAIRDFKFTIPQGMKPVNICREYSPNDRISIEEYDKLKDNLPQEVREAIEKHPSNIEERKDWEKHKTLSHSEFGATLTHLQNGAASTVLRQLDDQLKNLRKMGLKGKLVYSESSEEDTAVGRKPTSDFYGSKDTLFKKRYKEEMKKFGKDITDFDSLTQFLNTLPDHDRTKEWDTMTKGTPQMIHIKVRPEEGKEEILHYDPETGEAKTRKGVQTHGLYLADQHEIDNLKKWLTGRIRTYDPSTGQERVPLTTHSLFLFRAVNTLEHMKPGERIPNELENYVRKILLGGKKISGYTDVLVNSNTNGKRLALIRDKAGKWSSIVHPKAVKEKDTASEWRTVMSMLEPTTYGGETKSRYEHLKAALGKRLRIDSSYIALLNQQANEAHEKGDFEGLKKLEKKLSETISKRNTMGIYLLILETGFRPGKNRRSVEEGKDLVGATTIAGRHVFVDDEDKALRFSFSGKLGKYHPLNVYRAPELFDLFKSIRSENMDYARRNFERIKDELERRGNFGNAMPEDIEDIYDSMPMFRGVTKTGKDLRKDLISQTGSLLSDIGLPKDEIENLEMYDNRRLVFNTLAHAFSKKVAEDLFKHYRDTGRLDKGEHILSSKHLDEGISRVLDLVSTRSNNASHTLEKEYLIPGLVSRSIDNEFSNLVRAKHEPGERTKEPKRDTGSGTVPKPDTDESEGHILSGGTGGGTGVPETDVQRDSGELPT